MDDVRISPAGDPFTAKTHGRRSDETIEAHFACLARLEDDLRHADLGIEERCELEDHILRIRRRLGR
jgi:hypothetical protein